MRASLNDNGIAYCMQLIDRMSPESVGIELAVDPDDDHPIPYVVLNVDADMSREDFREEVKRIYRELRERECRIVDTLVIRRRT